MVGALDGGSFLKVETLATDEIIAKANEIKKLLRYQTECRFQRKFSKTPALLVYQSLFSRSPYYFLLDQWVAHLGSRAERTLRETWHEFGLEPNETRSSLLRPCLLKCFLKATQLAVHPESLEQIRKSLSAFEGNYFNLRTSRVSDETSRFTLLACLQKGLGALLVGPARESDRQSSSHKLSCEPSVAEWELQLESDCRNGRWIDAWRRLKKRKSLGTTTSAYKLLKILDGLSAEGYHQGAGSQLLGELAGHTKFTRVQRRKFACRAWDHRELQCRVGRLEQTTLELFSVRDPVWTKSLESLYRNCSVPQRWRNDLRTLSRKGAWKKRKCRILFDLLRYPVARAQHSLEQNLRSQTHQPFDYAEALESLRVSRASTALWLERLEAVLDSEIGATGELVLLSRETEDVLTEVCGLFSLPKEQRVEVSLQFDAVKFRSRGGDLSILVHPEFLSCPESQQQFLLARAVFRELSGLRELEKRIRVLSTPKGLANRALEYAEWNGHDYQLLDTARRDEVQVEVLLSALETTYWKTEDRFYRSLALLLCQPGWTPSLEARADVFASQFTDVVSASHALVKEDMWSRNVLGLSPAQGLEPLTRTRGQFSRLCLRLQRLWIHFLA